MMTNERPATPISDSITYVYELTYGLYPDTIRVALFSTLEAAQAQHRDDVEMGRDDRNFNIEAVEVFTGPVRGL